MDTFTFTDSNGNPVTIHPEQIVRVARPTGNFPGEIELSTGAKWGFGGESRMMEYRRAKAIFEMAHEEAKKQEE